MSISAEHGLTYEFTLKDRLRVAREEAGYTVLKFTEVVGISRNTIAAYESGQSRVPRSAILLWAMATGFDRGWLETGKYSTGDNGPEAGINTDAASGHAITGVRTHLVRTFPLPTRLAMAA